MAERCALPPGRAGPQQGCLGGDGAGKAAPLESGLPSVLLRGSRVRSTAMDRAFARCEDEMENVPWSPPWCPAGSCFSRCCAEAGPGAQPAQGWGGFSHLHPATSAPSLVAEPPQALGEPRCGDGAQQGGAQHSTFPAGFLGASGKALTAGAFGAGCAPRPEVPAGVGAAPRLATETELCGAKQCVRALGRHCAVAVVECLY